MFIKKLRIKNFKCFDKDVRSLEFNIPDGKTSGSGLNIFVGNNNSGKSTIFEAVDFLRNSTKKDLEDIKNKKAETDDEMFVEITFVGEITSTIKNFSQRNKKKFSKTIFIKATTKNILKFQDHQKALKNYSFGIKKKINSRMRPG